MTAPVFQLPPTHSEVILQNAEKHWVFNPIWSKWFLDLTRVLTNSGGGSGTIVHNSTSGLQGGGTGEYYHLTAAEHTYLTDATATSAQFLRGDKVWSNHLTGSFLVDGDVTVGDASGDTLTINAGTWTLGSNSTATRALGAAPAGTTIATTWATTFSGDPGGTSLVRGSAYSVTLSGANQAAAVATRNDVTHSGSNTLTTGLAQNSAVTIASTGNATTINPYRGSVAVTSSGNVTTAEIYRAVSPTLSSTGAITSMTGFHATDMGHATLVTNARGFLADDQTASVTTAIGYESQVSSGTGKIGFYASGTAANIFNGTVTLSAGATAPSGQQIIIGSAAAIAVGGSATDTLQMFGASAAAANSLARWQANTAGPISKFAKSRNASIGSFTIVQSGDSLGSIRFYGDNGTDFSSEAARINCAVDGTPGAGTDMPGRFEFLVSPDGTATPAIALTISNTKAATFAGAVTAQSTLAVTGAVTLTVPLSEINGGTNQSTYAQGDMLYASAANTLSKLAKDTNSTRYISNTGASNNPAWAQVALTTGVSGTLPEGNGGTNQSTYTQGDTLYASAANTLSKLAKDTNATRYLSNTGASNGPAWAQVDLTNGVSGDLPYSSLAQGSALSVLGVTGNATADVASIAAGSDKQVLRRSGTALTFGAIDISSSSAVTGNLGVANLGSGTGADSRTFWRGDASWARSWNMIVKTADQAKTSNTTLAADTELQLSVSANKSYSIRFIISGTFLNVAGFKYRITGPASPTLVNFHLITTSLTLGTTDAWATAFDSSDRTFTAGAENFMIEITMMLQNGANAGTVALQWAQNSSNVNATTVFKGSAIEYSQID